MKTNDFTVSLNLQITKEIVLKLKDNLSPVIHTHTLHRERQATAFGSENYVENCHENFRETKYTGL